MRFFASRLAESRSYQNIVAALEKPGAVLSLSEAELTAKAALCFALIENERRPLLYIAGDENEANRMREMLASLLGRPVSYFPMNDYAIGSLDTRSHEWEHARLSALCAILDEDARDLCPVCVTTADAVCRRTLPPERLSALTVRLVRGESRRIEDVVRVLT